MAGELVSAIVEMREDDALDVARAMLGEGQAPAAILEACREAMDIVGKQFECGDAFIPELILSGEILKGITEIVKPHLEPAVVDQTLTKVVIGTVQGDIHDIAKDIVAFMLEINGFEVVNLGVDVTPARFVEAVAETGARIVALSGFLTLAYDPMKETVEALAASGPDVKVMIGGGQVDETVLKYTGAHAYGRDAMTAVSLAKSWM
jgi:methanogenic corrinoid protein MtbC1